MHQNDATVACAIEELQKLKTMCERAISQLSDEALFVQIGPDQNSIYVIMKHLAGNMISRWTDFRTTDGEKPDRNRDEEFVERVVPRAEIMAHWERGWACAFDALWSIQPGELEDVIHIRGEPHSICRAISRYLSHVAYHTGQIVLIAKHLKGPAWQYLTIPRGQSDQFNRQKFAEGKPPR